MNLKKSIWMLDMIIHRLDYRPDPVDIFLVENWDLNLNFLIE